MENNPQKPDTDDLLYIPDFFRRVGWTQEMHQRSEEGYVSAHRQQRRQEALTESRIRAKAEKIRCEKEAALEAKRERKIEREQSAANTRTKKEERNTLIELIDKRIDTHGKLVKATGFDGKRISNHLRYLLNYGKIHKATPRRYAGI